MTVRELLEKLENLHPSLPVLLPAPDHSYRAAVAEVGMAIFDQTSASWSEDDGEDGRARSVVVIR